MPPRDTSVNAVFMLNADQVIAFEIEKLSGSLIRGQIFLIYYLAHLAGIVVFRIRIIHWNRK
jgi:hypothetical protein